MWFLTLFALAPSVGALTLGIDGALHLSAGAYFHAVKTDGSVRWTFDANFPIQAYKEGLNGTIHIVAQPTSQLVPVNMTYYVLDGADGSIQQQRTASGCPQGSKPTSDIRFLSSDNPLYLVCKPPYTGGSGRSFEIEAIDVTGALKWAQWIDGAIDVDDGPDGSVLVHSTKMSQPHPRSHTLSALKPESGAVKWTLTLDESYGEVFGWAISKGDVYVAPDRVFFDREHSSYSYALDLLHVNGEDGSILWNVSYGVVDSQYWGPSTPISGCKGEVYVRVPASNISDFIAFDSNGSKLRSWRLPCHPPSFAPLVPSGFRHSIRQIENGVEEDMFVSDGYDDSSNQTRVIAYSGTTGHFLWNTSIDGRYLVKDFGPDGTVFAQDSPLAAVAIHNGYEAWQAQSYEAVLMAMDGTTYLQYHESVVAVAMNGVQKWTYSIMDPTDGSVLNAHPFPVVV